MLSTSQLTINLKDVNDNEPIFLESSYTRYSVLNQNERETMYVLLFLKWTSRTILKQILDL